VGSRGEGFGEEPAAQDGETSCGGGEVLRAHVLTRCTSPSAHPGFAPHLTQVEKGFPFCSLVTFYNTLGLERTL